MNDNTLDKITFPQKVSVVQQIIDIDTGEILFSLTSKVSFFCLNFFVIVLRKYFMLLREKKNLMVQIRSSQIVVQKDIPFGSVNDIPASDKGFF
jgi:hypothetical protein